MKKMYADEIIRTTNGSLYSREYANINNITGEVVNTSLSELRGQKVICSYSQIFYPDSNMILCNNIPSVDEFLFDNIENGSFEYCEDVNGIFFTYDEAQEKIEEAQEEIERLEEAKEESSEEEAETIQEEIEAIQENIEALEDVHQDEIFQYFIIDNGTAERLKNSTNEIIFYSEKLDVYILGVTHLGTSWNYVRAEFIL